MFKIFIPLLDAEPELGGGGAVKPVAEPTTPSIGADGTLGDGWYRSLGDEYSESGDDLGKHKNIQSLIQERNYFRGKQISTPSEDSTPEDITAYRTHFGVPTDGTAEAYGIDFSEESDQNKAIFDRLAGVYHDKHGSPAAFQAAIGEYKAIQTEVNQELEDQQAASIKEAQDGLIADWRGDFDAHSSTARHVTTRLAEAAGITEDDPALQALANTPAFAKIMLEVSKLTSEDRTHSPAGMSDFRSAQQRATAIMDGTDQQWGEKYANGDPEAYKIAVSLLKKSKE